jgi:hypothetical protein
VQSSFSLIVATRSRPLLLLVKRAVCDHSVTIQQAELDPALIFEAVRNDGGGRHVIFVDGIQREEEALVCISALNARGCTGRCVMFGTRADSDVLVNASRQGAWDYLVSHATLEDISQAIVGASKGTRPSVHTVFGAMRACTEATRTKEGHYVQEDGSILTAQEFSRLCKMCGVSAEQVASVAERPSGVRGEDGGSIQDPGFRRARGRQQGGSAGLGGLRGEADARQPTQSLRLLSMATAAFVLFLGTAMYYRLGGGRGTVVVQGTLSFDGQPLQRGSIMFDPIKSDNSRVSAVIREGRFRTDLEPGLKRGGAYVLRVYAYRLSSTQQEQVGDATKVYVQEQFVPSRFNRDSGIRVDITPDIVASGLVLDLRQGKSALCK